MKTILTFEGNQEVAFEDMHPSIDIEEGEVAICNDDCDVETTYPLKDIKRIIFIP